MTGEDRRAGDGRCVIDQAITAVFTYAVGNALGPAATASFSRKLAREGGGAAERMGEMMTEARDIASQFPRLYARLDSPAAEYGASPEGSFRFGLEAILDGLEARRSAGDGTARLLRVGRSRS